MITLDKLKSLEDLKYAEAYDRVDSLAAGEQAAIDYFKEIHDGEWSDDMVSFYGPKKFRSFDIETTVYEAYVDSGSVDYFFFSYETKL